MIITYVNNLVTIFIQVTLTDAHTQLNLLMATVTSASQARLVLGLVTTFGGSTIPVFSRLLRPTQPGRPSVGQWLGAASTGDSFGHH